MFASFGSTVARVKEDESALAAMSDEAPLTLRLPKRHKILDGLDDVRDDGDGGAKQPPKSGDGGGGGFFGFFGRA